MHAALLVGAAVAAAAPKKPGLSVVASGMDVAVLDNCRVTEWLPGVLAPPVGLSGKVGPSRCPKLYRLGDGPEVPAGTSISVQCHDPVCSMIVSHHHEPPHTAETNGALPALLSGGRWHARYGGVTVDSNGTRRPMVHHQTAVLQNETLVIELEKPLRYGYLAWVPSPAPAGRRAEAQEFTCADDAAQNTFACLTANENCLWINMEPTGACVARPCVDQVLGLGGGGGGASSGTGGSSGTGTGGGGGPQGFPSTSTPHPCSYYDTFTALTPGVPATPAHFPTLFFRSLSAPALQSIPISQFFGPR
eukprot:TRINITY_DN1538_c0_g1_i1.p2 TRINITY_DN1538_c0_g1~~TRINITY_DN1538_c0_g1_i1.p2  ORF type:complete len:305 (+),score=100.38 TRINITY_DN1538_c0_g1_i1:61-975(+)